MHIVRDAHKFPHTSDAKGLFLEYSRWVGERFGVSLSFQGFEKEMAQFPGDYAPPRGRVLLVRAGAQRKPAGCIALRPIATGVCEMKRLYVRPDFRGLRVGERLVDALIEEARDIGYARMVLDTFRSGMEPAIGLYRSFGFEEIGPHHEVPDELRDKILFMGVDLYE